MSDKDFSPQFQVPIDDWVYMLEDSGYKQVGSIVKGITRWLVVDGEKMTYTRVPDKKLDLPAYKPVIRFEFDEKEKQIKELQEKLEAL